MEEPLILMISTQWRAQSHKWDILEDGTILYRDEYISPREVYRRFLVDYPMFNVLRAEVSRRVNVGGQERPYAWVDIERFQ